MEPNHSTSRDGCMEEGADSTVASNAEEVAMLLRGSSGLELLAEDVLINQPYQRQEALAYLIDFMESRGTLHLLRFWMEVQHFSQVHMNTTDSRMAWTGGRLGADHADGIGVAGRSAGSDPSMGRLALVDAVSDDCHNCCCGDTVFHTLESATERSCTTATELAPPRLVNNPEMEECALRIFGQYLGLDAPEALQLPVEDPDALRHGVLELMCREDGCTDLDCFQLPQQLAWHLIASRYFEHFRSSHHFLQYKSHLVLSDHFYLFDILNSPQTLPYFLEYSEWCGQPYMDALCFVLSCLQFLRHCQPDGTGAPPARPAVSRDQIASDACAIFDKYLTPRKCSEILADKGIPEMIGRVLPVRVGATAVDADLIGLHFRQALARLYDYFSKVHLASFFRSQSFMRFLVDLEVQQKVALFEAGLYRPNTPIDAQTTSRERGFREQRSSASRQSSSGKCLSPSITDSRSVSRLDSVDEPAAGMRGCRSSIAGSSDYGSSVDLSGTSEAPVRALKKMTLGEVDALGRFVSFAENEPAGNKSNLHFLRRTIRRLKKVEEQRRKDEEAALEAQRIIEDTLQMGQCPSLDLYS